MAASVRHVIRLAGTGLALVLLGVAARRQMAQATARRATAAQAGQRGLARTHLRASVHPFGAATAALPAARPAGGWLAERGRDVLRWPYWLIRDAPVRSQRLAETLRAGREGWAAFRAVAQRGGDLLTVVAATRDLLGRSALWLSVLLAQIFDLFGGPEAAEIVVRGLSQATPLTAEEETEGRGLLGGAALEWREVRIAQGGILDIAFWANKQRAFTLWHTINLPRRGGHTRANVPIVIHELVHVYQYEKVGSAYLAQAVDAQHSAAGYGYGQVAGLQSDRAAGLAYRHYNREQQAQIIQDYFSLLRAITRDEREEEQRQEALACYADCVAEMRSGLI